MDGAGIPLSVDCDLHGSHRPLGGGLGSHFGAPSHPGLSAMWLRRHDVANAQEFGLCTRTEFKFCWGYPPSCDSYLLCASVLPSTQWELWNSSLIELR